MSFRKDFSRFLSTKSRSQKIAVFGWGAVGLVMTTMWPLLGNEWRLMTLNGIGIVVSMFLVLMLSFLDWKF